MARGVSFGHLADDPPARTPTQAIRPAPEAGFNLRDRRDGPRKSKSNIGAEQPETVA